MSQTETIDAESLKGALHDGLEIALLDVREPGEYGEGHLFYAVNTPYSTLERDVSKLVPNKSVRVILVDDTGDGVALLAAKRLKDLGYRHVLILQDGQAGWGAAGYEIFAGVNVPSKAFGELAEHHYHTPRITAQELADKQVSGEKLAIFDGRPYAEYQKMNIPGARCCPNGELALRIDELVGDETTPIIINCAGRTRSIIGAQTLINLGVSNPVFALENGTQGWYLADQQLEHGSSHAWPPADPPSTEKQRERAQKLADRFGIQTVSMEQFNNFKQQRSRTTVLCDVRNSEEFQISHIAGAINAPGGQLIQATDQYVGIRGARLVLWDGDGVRAPVVAHWLTQLGWEVYVLDPAIKPNLIQATAAEDQSPTERLNFISCGELLELMKHPVTLIDLRSSASFRKGHVKGAVWLTRRDMREYLEDKESTPLVLIGEDKELLNNCLFDLKQARCSAIYGFLFDQSATAGIALAITPNDPPDEKRVDYLFFVHDRHEGNKAAARQYLAWELNLVQQLDEQEMSSFRLSERKA